MATFNVTAAPATSRVPAPTAPQVVQDSPSETVVKSGDTLTSIAKRNNVSLAQLRELNPQLFKDGKDSAGRKRAADGHWIYPGDKVRVRPAATAPLAPATGTAPLATDSATAGAAVQNRYGGYGAPETATPAYKAPGTDPKIGSAEYKSPGTDPKTGSAGYKSPGVDPKTGSAAYTPPKQAGGPAPQPTAATQPVSTPTAQDRYQGYQSPGTDNKPAPAAPPKARDGASTAHNGADNLEGQRHLLGAVHEQFSMVGRYDGGVSKEDLEFNVADRPGKAEILRDFDKYANGEGDLKKEHLERWMQDVDTKLGRAPVNFEAKADPRKELKLVNVIDKYFDKVADKDGKVSKEDIRKNVADTMEGRDALLRNFDKLAPGGNLTKSDLAKLSKQLEAGKTFSQIAGGG